MGAKNARKYTDDFKRRAVELAKDIGIAQAEMKLGIPHGNIRNWREKINKFGKVSRTDTKSPNESAEDQLRRLQKENSELKKANIILKAAAAFFSQDHLK